MLSCRSSCFISSRHSAMYFACQCNKISYRKYINEEKKFFYDKIAKNHPPNLSNHSSMLLPSFAIPDNNRFCFLGFFSFLVIFLFFLPFFFFACQSANIFNIQTFPRFAPLTPTPRLHCTSKIIINTSINAKSSIFIHSFNDKTIWFSYERRNYAANRGNCTISLLLSISLFNLHAITSLHTCVCAVYLLIVSVIKLQPFWITTFLDFSQMNQLQHLLF